MHGTYTYVYVDVYVYESDGKVYIDGVQVDLVASELGKPIIYNNRTFVPVSFLLEVLPIRPMFSMYKSLTLSIQEGV